MAAQNEYEEDPTITTNDTEQEMIEEQIDDNNSALEALESVTDSNDEDADGVELETINGESPTVESKDLESFGEEIDILDATSIHSPKVKAKIKTKGGIKPKSSGRGSPELSKLRIELQMHADSQKKVELTIRQIKMQLKEILLTHHTEIKGIRKQFADLRKKLSTIENSRKSTQSKTVSKKKKIGSKKSKQKKNRKKERKR